MADDGRRRGPEDSVRFLFASLAPDFEPRRALKLLVSAASLARVRARLMRRSAPLRHGFNCRTRSSA